MMTQGPWRAHILWYKQPVHCRPRMFSPWSTVPGMPGMPGRRWPWSGPRSRKAPALSQGFRLGMGLQARDL